MHTEARRELPAVLRDLPWFDESLRLFLDIWFELDRGRQRTSEGVSRISRRDVMDFLDWKRWNDDDEFKEDLWYFINELDDVALPIEMKNREAAAKAAKAEARRNGKHAKLRPQDARLRGRHT